MKKIVLKLVVNAVAIWAATYLVSGVSITHRTSAAKQALTLLLVAVIFGVVNTVIKPLVKLATLPVFFLTLGLITLVINAAMLGLTSWASQRLHLAFHVDSFKAAFLGALVISVVSMVLHIVVRDSR